MYTKLWSGVSVRLPWPGRLMPARLTGPPSGSLSLASASMVDRGAGRVDTRSAAAIGRGVARHDGDGHAGRAGPAAAVADGVAEAVDAAETRLRRVADLLVRLDLDRAMAGRVDADDAERVAVGVVVVGQHRHGDAVAGEHLGGVGGGDRGGVRARHGDRDLGRGGAADRRRVLCRKSCRCPRIAAAGV